MSGTIDIDERIRMTMDAASMAWWEMELPSGVVFFSEEKAGWFGGKPEDFVHYSSYTNKLNKDEYDKAMKSMRDHLEGKREHYTAIYNVVGLDGKNRTLYDKGKIVRRDKDGTVKVMGICIDMTNFEG